MGTLRRRLCYLRSFWDKRYHLETGDNTAELYIAGPTPTPTATPSGPTVTTNPATNVASFSAILNGTVNPHALTTSVHFQYGITTSYGSVTANRNFNGTTTQNVAANISALIASTTYHFRVVATNSVGH